jgi:hypothetical protein
MFSVNFEKFKLKFESVTLDSLSLEKALRIQRRGRLIVFSYLPGVDIPPDKRPKYSKFDNFSLVACFAHLIVLQYSIWIQFFVRRRNLLAAKQSRVRCFREDKIVLRTVLIDLGSRIFWSYQTNGAFIFFQ